jgi:hypothetical protein
MKRRCDKCEFWDKSGMEDFDKNEHDDDKAGCCKRYPPVRDMDWSTTAKEEIYLINGSCEDWRAWQQPITTASHWCGEFSTKTMNGDDTVNDSTLIEDLDLTVKSKKILISNNITTVGELLRLNNANLLKVPDLGLKSIYEIKELMLRHGLKWNL